MPDLQQLAHIAHGDDAAEQVHERDQTEHGGDAPDDMNDAIAEQRGHHDDRRKNQDADGVAHAEQLPQRLAR
ncbi:hypothetical protein D3C77_751660 [compost metagenome]